MRAKLSFKLLNTKKDLWVRLMVVPFVGLITPFLTDVVPDGMNEDIFFVCYPYLFTVFAVILMFEVNRFFLRLFRRRLKNYSTIAVRLVYQFFALTFISLLLMVILLFLWYEYILNVPDFNEFIASNVYVGLSIAIIFTMYYELSYYVVVWQKQSNLNQDLEMENIKSQLHLLKRQLSPHFMFNALSNLSSLIEVDKKEALVFLNRFSDAYRYLLSHDNEVLSPLNEELEFVETYMSILKSNYGEALRLNIDVSEECMNSQVPTLSLQMLVENAVKHNSSSYKNPLLIEISSDKSNRFVTVKNNLQFKKTITSTKTGLKSIVERYELLNNSSVEINKTEDFFSVELPLIKSL